jgi:hypothetical protein
MARAAEGGNQEMPIFIAFSVHDRPRLFLSKQRESAWQCRGQGFDPPRLHFDNARRYQDFGPPTGVGRFCVFGGAAAGCLALVDGEATPGGSTEPRVPLDTTVKPDCVSV